jgi:hypothetical protein
LFEGKEVKALSLLSANKLINEFAERTKRAKNKATGRDVIEAYITYVD